MNDLVHYVRQRCHRLTRYSALPLVGLAGLILGCDTAGEGMEHKPEDEHRDRIVHAIAAMIDAQKQQLESSESHAPNVIDQDFLEKYIASTETQGVDFVSANPLAVRATLVDDGFKNMPLIGVTYIGGVGARPSVADIALIDDDKVDLIAEVPLALQDDLMKRRLQEAMYVAIGIAYLRTGDAKDEDVGVVRAAGWDTVLLDDRKRSRQLHVRVRTEDGKATRWAPVSTHGMLRHRESPIAHQRRREGES